MGELTLPQAILSLSRFGSSNLIFEWMLFECSRKINETSRGLVDRISNCPLFSAFYVNEPNETLTRTD